MITVGCVATLLFLGGWTSPFGHLFVQTTSPITASLLSLFWFVVKVFFFLFLYIWVRGTLPRFRYDQLMGFGWKFLVPVAVANIVVTSFFLALRLPPH
jgi:NADH-quinone oxidoreductase subunit H